MVYRMYMMLALLLLPACQTASNHVSDFINNSAPSFNMMNNIAVIQHDFEHGRIMQARGRVLSLRQTNQDYAEAHVFLEETIEPARRKMFLHYLRTAKKAELNKRWYTALKAYDQAKAVTIKPKKMQQKRLEMEWKMRQLRFDKLLSQRRKEDQRLFRDVAAYAAPNGVGANDVVYGRFRAFYNESMDDRARSAYREAKRYLRKGWPEIAYVEVESYLRLQPEIPQGQKLMVEIRESLSHKLAILPESSVTAKARHSLARRAMASEQVTAKQIIAAISHGDLLVAEQLAQVYRRNHGKGAAKLLLQIETKLDVQAARLFSQGGQAFGQENLDKAIKHWRDAVVLRPEKKEYHEALRRAEQLKERLVLLRDQRFDQPSVDLIKPIPEEE